MGEEVNELFGIRLTATTGPIPTANADIQLVVAPWKLGKKIRLRKILISNTVGAQGRVVIWDQDLGSTTPKSYGSSGGALLILGVGGVATSGVGAVTAVYGEDTLPSLDFEAGIALQVSNVNMSVAAEYEQY